MADDARRGIGRIVIASLVSCAAIAGFFVWLYLRSPRNTVLPEDAAHAWAQKLQLPYRGAACTMFDSDDDGYVSCVLALDGADHVYFQGLQFGELYSRKGGGCKPDAKNPEVHLVLDLKVSPSGTIPR